MLILSNTGPAFTENGLSNWKNAMEKKKGFQKHESSDSHMEAVARYVMAPATVIVAFEDFNGMYILERTTADQVVAILKNALLRMNLNFQRARGKGFD